MSGITERVIITVSGGVEDWKEQLKHLLQALKKQPGYTRTRWGPFVEDAQKLEILIGWENAAACETWHTCPDFEESMTTFKPVMAGAATRCFVSFKPHAPKEIIDSPLVETITFHGYSGSEDDLRAQLEKAKSQTGCNGVASGMSSGETSGNFVAVVGWTSLDASKAADKGYAAGASESHHVNFNFPIKGFHGL